MFSYYVLIDIDQRCNQRIAVIRKKMNPEQRSSFFKGVLAGIFVCCSAYFVYNRFFV